MDPFFAFELFVRPMVELDFNYAYNPLCDYNPDKFNCTLPPASNKLSFAAAAGEQKFSLDH